MKTVLIQRLGALTCLVAACNFLTESGGDSKPKIVPNGLIVGGVYDPSGRGVANAAVCASAYFDVSGTPFLLVSHAKTNNAGLFNVLIDWDVRADIRGGLTVAATPPVGSGLAPTTQPRLTVLVSAVPPPQETTFVYLEVAPGTPYNGEFCIYGS